MEEELFPVDKSVNSVSKPEKKLKKEKLSGEQFFIFWKAYPRKTGKYLAQKIWSKLDNSGELFKNIMDSLQIDKQSKPWFEKGGIYIPYPATWLNQKRWEDNEPQKMSATDIKKLESVNAQLERLKEREIQRIHGEKK